MWGWNGVLALLLLFGCFGGLTAQETISNLPEIRYTKVSYINNNVTDLGYRAKSEANHPFYMEGFYAFTNAFIDLIQSKQILPEGAFIVNNKTVKNNSDAGKEFRHYGVFISFMIILLIIAIVLPFIGCCICCCSGNSDYSDDYDNLRFRKNLISGFLIFIFVLLLFGFTFAILSNAAVHNGTNELPDYLNDTIHDLGLYIYSVTDDIEVLLKRNFHELSGGLVSMLGTCGDNVLNELKKFEDLVALDELDNMVSGLEHIKEDLTEINTISGELQNNATELDTEFERIRTKLLNTVKTCGSSCDDIKKVVEENKISAAEEFKKLPVDKVKTALTTVENLLENNIVGEVGKGREVFLGIQTEIQNKVNNSLPKAIKKIQKIENKLNSVFDDASQKMNETFLVFLEEDTEPVINDVRYYIAKYSIYWFYFGLAICCVLIVISALVFLGVICGMCDKRPDDYDKGCGPCFLNTALWMIFSIISIFMILNVIQILAGIVSERIVCEPLKNPNDNRIFKIADDLLDFKNFSFGSIRPPKLTVGGIIDACHRNEPLVKVFKMEEVADFEYWKNETDSFKVNETINEIVEQINLSGNYKFLTQDAKDKLNNLANSGMDEINFDEFENILKENITDINLYDYAKYLRDFANKLPAEFETVKTELLTDAEDIEKCQNKYIVPMTNSCHDLADTVLELREEIKFNKTSIKVAIDDLITKVNSAEDWINHEALETIKTLAKDLGGSIYSSIHNFIVHVTQNIRDEVGKCGPLSNLYKATIVAGCDKVLDPFNGFWFGIGWCLLLFIPVIILSIKLIALQKQSDNDSGFIFGKSNDIEPVMIIPKNPLYMDGSYSPVRRDSNPFQRNYGSRVSKRY